MERLVTVQAMAERYGCSLATARKYIRDMEHMECPLMVSEQAVRAWERRKTIQPAWLIRQEMRRRVNR